MLRFLVLPINPYCCAPLYCIVYRDRGGSFTERYPGDEEGMFLDAGGRGVCCRELKHGNVEFLYVIRNGARRLQRAGYG